MRILFATLLRAERFSNDPAADLAGALPRVLAARGHQVAVVTPASGTQAPPSTGRKHRLSLGLKGRSGSGTCQEIPHPDGYSLFLVDAPHLGPPPAEEGQDLPERVAAFGHAALLCCKPLGFSPEVIHVNDWCLGPLCALLEERYRDLPELNGCGTVFTFHDLEGPRLFPPEAMMSLGLDWSLFTPDQLEFSGKVSFLKAGLVFADRLTTGSRSFANEIKTPPLGRGLESLLRERGNDLRGIPHGLELQAFEPGPAPQPLPQLEVRSPAGKAACKAALQQSLGLPVVAEHPLVTAVLPFSGRAGFDLLLQAAPELLQLDIQLLLAGRGDPAVEAAVQDLAARFPHRLAVRLADEKEVARDVLAGADVALFPAREAPYAPLLLAALRLGTIPVARATGMLADTVEDFSQGEGCGFTFERAEAPELLAALRRALQALASPDATRALRAAAMSLDLSWDIPARRYESVYREAVALRR